LKDLKKGARSSGAFSPIPNTRVFVQGIGGRERVKRAGKRIAVKAVKACAEGERFVKTKGDV